MATGLLIVCAGKKTRRFLDSRKCVKFITGTITLGGTTASMDAETEITNVKAVEKISDKTD